MNDLFRTSGGGPSSRLDEWLREYLLLGRRLGGGEIGGEAWQDAMDPLLAQCPAAELAGRIDLDAAARRLRSSDMKGRGELFQTVFTDASAPSASPGPEIRRAIIAKIAYVKRGGSVPPHGHNNMVSAFLHLSGTLRVRQYERVADLGDALLIRASADVVVGAGTWSSVSDTRHNIHWLTGESDDCFLFTTKLIALDPAARYEGRIYIDMSAPADAGGGLLRAQKLHAGGGPPANR
jgi:hypothetical protein